MKGNTSLKIDATKLTYTFVIDMEARMTAAEILVEELQIKNDGN